jgi:hypothetical protein
MANPIPTPYFGAAGMEAVVPTITTAPPSTLPSPPDLGSAPPTDSLTRILTFKQPSSEEIPLAVDFNTLGFKASAAVEVGINIPGAEFIMQKGYVGRLESIIFYVANLLLTSNITFTVLQDFAPLPGLTNIAIFPGIAARVNNTITGKWLLPDGCRLSVIYSNNDGGAYEIGAALSGWSWPEQAGKQWLLTGPVGE